MMTDLTAYQRLRTLVRARFPKARSPLSLDPDRLGALVEELKANVLVS